MGGVHGGHDPAGVFHFPVESFQFLVLARLKACRLDLIDLKFEEGHPAVPLLLGHLAAAQLLLKLRVDRVGSLHFLFRGGDLIAPEAVDEFELVFRPEKLLVLALPVDIEEQGSDSPRFRCRPGLPVDADRAAVSLHFP